MDSTAGQLVSSFGANKLNELRLPVRASSSELDRERRLGHRAGDSRSPTPAIGFGGPVVGTGQGNAGFDFKQNITQAIDNFTYLRGGAQLQGRVRLAAHLRRAHQRAAVRLHASRPSPRIMAAKSGRRTARLHDDVADHRRPVVQHEHRRVQHVRAGRLADCADGEDPLRRPLRSLQVPCGHRRRAAGADARVQHRQEQLRPARRRGVVGRSTSTVLRASTGIDVRPADSRRRTSRRCSCPDRRAPRSTPSTARRPAPRRSRTASTRALSASSRRGRSIRISRSRARGRPTRSWSARSCSDFTGVDRRHLREGLASAGRDQHQPDQSDRTARRRPADLQHDRQRDDAARSALQPDSGSAVDRRLDVQVDDAADRRSGSSAG